MEIKFDSIAEMISSAQNTDVTISKICLMQSAQDMEISEDELYASMAKNLKVMKDSIKNGSKKGVKSVSGLTGGMAYAFKTHVADGNSISGNLLSETIYNALAVAEENACMGRIVASPTAGSCGIVPGCLIALQNNYENIDDDKLIMGLFNSAAIGMVLAKNASISGAEGGCQAECGSAAAMAASAIVEIMGGTPEMCGHAAAQAIKSLMGLVCDPVAGLVEEPCVIRNASSAGIAVMAADISLAGIKSIIPVDEVIQAMDKVGKMLPFQLRETALGGIADTKTAKKITKELFN